MQKKLFQTLLIATMLTPSVVMAKGACQIQGAKVGTTECHCGKGKTGNAEKTETCMQCGSGWANPDALICSCIKPGSKYWHKICGASTKETSSKTGGN